MKRALTQQEIDEAFGGAAKAATPAEQVEQFDVRKLDKLAKTQLQSLHLVHESFARSVTSSLSAYLRSYIVLSLISLEQIPYGDFLESLSVPACIAYLGLDPFDGFAVLDINVALAFRFIELLLGSKEQSSMPVHRKITDIEKRLLTTLLRVIVNDLHDSWKSVADVGFNVQSLASEPQLLHVLPPSEAMVVIAIDVRLGSTSGLINLAIPTTFVKRLRSNFEQLQRIRRTEASESEQKKIGQLLENLILDLDVQIPAGELFSNTLLDLQVGDTLVLEHSRKQALRGLLNGKQQWLGNIEEFDGRLGFRLTD